MVSATSAKCGVSSLHSLKSVVLLGMERFLHARTEAVDRNVSDLCLSQLLTLDEKDPRRLFEGNALLRRLVRVGVLEESRMKLDYVLGLRIEDFMERRLETQVFKHGLAKSIHHARVLIRQRHIRVRKQVVN